MNKEKKYIRIGLFVLFSLIIVASILFLIFNRSKKLVCEAPEGSITLNYKGNKIVGYTARNFTFDLNGANESIKDIGMDEYLLWFKGWFIENSNGMCKDTKKLSCHSDEGGIILYYDDDNLITVEADNLSFDLPAAKESVKQSGIDKYIADFKIWFAGNSSGKCE